MRSGQGDTEEHRIRIKEMELRLKESNKRRDQEMKDVEEKKRLDEQELERQKQRNADDRQNALDEANDMARLDKEVAEANAQEAKEVEKEDIAEDDIFDSVELDSKLRLQRVWIRGLV